MFSNRADHGKRIDRLLQIGSEKPKGSKAQTRRRTETRLTDSQVHELIGAYMAGPTTYQLASRFGVHRVTVSKLLVREGVALRNRSLTDSQVQRAITRYRSGLSLAQVGTQAECDASTVRLALALLTNPDETIRYATSSQDKNRASNID